MLDDWLHSKDIEQLPVWLGIQEGSITITDHKFTDFLADKKVLEFVFV